MNQKSDVVEMAERLKSNELEMQELRERRADIIKEYRDRLDVKAVRAAIHISKIVVSVGDRSALDEALGLLAPEFGIDVSHE